MNMFLQRLYGNPICILRAGEFATDYGKKFALAAVVDVLEGKGIIRALVAAPPKCEACEWHQKLTMSYASNAFELIRRELKVEPDWERFS